MLRIWRAAIAAFALAFVCAPALAQSSFPTVGGSYVDGHALMCVSNGTAVPCASSGGELIVSGTFSASLAGFQPTPAYSTLAVGASSTRVALPSGTVVIVYNTGANDASVTLGNSSVVATGANDIVKSGQSVAFTVGSFVDLAAIEATGAGGTTSLVISGGSGLPTGWGAGGGGGGSFTWPGTAGNATGGSSPGSGTMPFVNGIVQGPANSGTPVVGWPVRIGGETGAGNVGEASTSTWGAAPSGLTVLGVNADVLSSALPTGAATSALQPALNGDGGALAHVTNFPATQPVSAASLPLPTGAATAANQEVTAAGTTATSAQAVQGVTGGVAMPVSAASLPLPSGAATAANQEVTVAGTTASSAQATQGVTGGVPFQVQNATDSQVTTGNITAVDVGTSCSSTPTFQTACTGTATANACVVASAAGSYGYLNASAVLSAGTLTAASLRTEVSFDNGTTWYGRGLFLDSNFAPIWQSNLGPPPWSGEGLGGGYTNWRVCLRSATGSGYTVGITIRQGQSAPFNYTANLPTSANGTAATAAVPVQGNGTSASPINTNLQQVANTTLGAPTAVGTQGTGNAQNVNATIVGGTVSATFSPFAPNGNFATLSVGSSTGNVALPTGTAVDVSNTGSFAAFVNLGATSGTTATASDIQVAPGGFKCFAVGSNTYLAAIETAGATNLNIAGGSGGCAGSGGGGGGTSSIPVTSAGTSATSAAAIQGVTGGVPLPVNGLFIPTATPAINISTATTTLLVAAVSGKSIYVTSWDVVAPSGNFTLEYGTQTTNPCDTSTTALTGPYAMNGGQIGKGTGSGIILTVPTSDQLCAVTSAAVQYSGALSVVQQ